MKVRSIVLASTLAVSPLGAWAGTGICTFAGWQRCNQGDVNCVNPAQDGKTWIRAAVIHGLDPITCNDDVTISEKLVPGEGTCTPNPINMTTFFACQP